MPPSIFPEYLYDSAGKAYAVAIVSQSATFFSAHIYYGRMWLGRINWLIADERNVMQLADLVLFDEPLGHHPLWARITSLLRWHPPNFRQRGLGSAMLCAVITQAEKLKVDAISGFITTDDLQKTPYLLEFYKKHGFDVQRISQPTQGTVATIHRKIHHANGEEREDI